MTSNKSTGFSRVIRLPHATAMVVGTIHWRINFCSTLQGYWANSVDLAGDVPQGDIDGADGNVEDRAASPAVHRLPVLLDLYWVLADDMTFVFLDGRDHRGGAAANSAFAHPGDSGVGVELDEDVVHRLGPDRDDLQLGHLEIGRDLAMKFGGEQRMGSQRSGYPGFQAGLQEGTTAVHGGFHVEVRRPILAM